MVNVVSLLSCIFGAGMWRKQKKYYEQENNIL